MGRIIPLFLLFLVLVIIFLPAALVRGCRGTPATPPPVLDRAPIISPGGEITLRVYCHDRQESVELALEEYLVGVVAAEMPAVFGLEALKAQAVAARTFTLNQMPEFGGPGCPQHPGNDICTSARHCQAYETEKKSLAKWPPSEAAANYNRIRAAVRQTAGLVISYQGRLTDAVFHSHCGGHTEDSEKVWSAALPYLRGVPCGYCNGARWDGIEQGFTAAEFAAALRPYVTAAPVSAAGRPLLSLARRTPTGRVLTLRVGGETVSGRDLRSALGLPSTNFSWHWADGQITFSSRGHGHGVGLCQYGADGLAGAGRTFREIIAHYYSGVAVVTVSSLRQAYTKEKNGQNTSQEVMSR